VESTGRTHTSKSAVQAKAATSREGLRAKTEYGNGSGTLSFDFFDILFSWVTVSALKIGRVTSQCH
jgi:hypothetical protein